MRQRPGALKRWVRRNTPSVLRRAQCSRFQRDLQLLNDVFEETPLAGRYWLRGGLLLGWAREKRILKHDCRDADFGYLRTDRAHFLGALPALLAAGFKPGNIFRNNDEEVTEYRVCRHGARFEFFEMTEVGAKFEYFLYHDHPPLQLRCRLPRHGLDRISFLNRQWYKPDRHEEQLEIMYGAWRIPDPDHHYTNSGAAIERTPWVVRKTWKLN